MNGPPTAARLARLAILAGADVDSGSDGNEWHLCVERVDLPAVWQGQWRHHGGRWRLTEARFANGVHASRATVRDLIEALGRPV